MKRKNIAVLMTALDSDGQVEILRGMEACGRKNGCNIAVFLWFTGVYEKERHNLGEINIAMLPDLNLFDGIILLADIFHMESNRERIEKVLERVKCPIVTIGCKYKDVPSVCADNYEGMRKLMEYLVKERGLRRLHFVRGVAGNDDAEARFQAYRDVLEENGIRVEEERISQGDFYVLGGEKAAHEILSQKIPFPEAIVCANDTMAVTICDILAKKGYRVPEDVIITGYDYSIECQVQYPQIISVKIQGAALGEQACRILLDSISGTPVQTEYKVPDEMVFERETMAESSGDFLMQGAGRSVTMQRVMIHHIITLEKSIMETNSFDIWKDAVKSFIEQIEPGEFYCCVNQGFEKNVFQYATVEQETRGAAEWLAYSEMAEVLVAYKDGSFFEKASFASKYGLDSLFDDCSTEKLYIFSPFHYLERNYGYFVFADSFFPLGNPLYITWLNYMGNSVESIRKQTMVLNAMVKLDEMYIRDSLTGVYNRFGMERYFAIVKEKCIDQQIYLHLSFADIDGLKKINDVFGHEEGDRIIRAVGRILQEEAEAAYVVRYGGDEFIVMGAAEEKAEAENYWSRVYEAIDRYNAQQEGKAVLSISAGYNLVHLNPYSELDDCIRDADKRMYAEKKRKKSMK